MRRPGPILRLRDIACLAVLLASVSCTPPDTPRPAAAAHPAAPPATGAASASTVAAPLPVLLAPPANGIAADQPVVAEAPPFDQAAASADDTARATECLTAAVYYEARSEPVDGQRAVAQVVLNRVRNPAFPASVCGVVYQRSQSVCQFTFACDGSMLHPRDWAAWTRARAVASQALAGAVYAPVGAATFYHTVAVAPWWAASLNRIATIGAHIFYRLGNAWSGALDFHQAYAAAEPAAAVAARSDDVGLTANVLRFVTEQGAVSVHHGAASLAGVVVHHGTADGVAANGGASTDDAGNDGTTLVAGVRIHAGAPPSPATADARKTAELDADGKAT